MGRWVLNFVTAASAVLLAALFVAWVRQPVNVGCFSTGLPGGRVLIVRADDRLNVTVWRDWPLWERPALHSHFGHGSGDLCGPLYYMSGTGGGTWYRVDELGLGVRQSDVTALCGMDYGGKPQWPERRNSSGVGSWFGAGWSSYDSPPPIVASYRQWVVPYWIAFAGAAPLPALGLGLAVTGRVRSRRRLGRGLCVRCGYDLTGNVSGVCPECGTAPAERRARRNEPRLLSPVTLSLLLLCAALGWVMTRPGVRAYTLWTTFESRWSFVTAPLTVRLERRTYVMRSTFDPRSRPAFNRRFMGFGYAQDPLFGDRRPDDTYRQGWIRAWYAPSLVLPLAFLVLLSWAGVRAGRTVRRRLRQSNGRCRECGYDLTGNVSGVCPECGRRRADALNPDAHGSSDKDEHRLARKLGCRASDPVASVRCAGPWRRTKWADRRGGETGGPPPGVGARGAGWGARTLVIRRRSHASRAGLHRHRAGIPT